MAVIATDSTRFSAVVKFELEPQLGICREAVVLNDAAGGVYKVGAVLAKTGGKYHLAGDADVAVAVLIADGLGLSKDITLAAGVDANALVLARGPVIVADAALQLAAGKTLAEVKTELAAVGIIVEAAV